MEFQQSFRQKDTEINLSMDTKMGNIPQGNKNVIVEVLFSTGQKSTGSSLSLNQS